MKKILFGGLLLVCAWAFAHSNLAASSIKDGATLKTRPASVQLTMSEAFEPKFSVFKVYKLATAAQTPSAWRAAAKPLLQKLSQDDAKNPARKDAQVMLDATATTKAMLHLKKLEPGVYAVVWRTLGVDTHTESDLLVFRYKP